MAQIIDVRITLEDGVDLNKYMWELAGLIVQGIPELLSYVEPRTRGLSWIGQYRMTLPCLPYYTYRYGPKILTCSSLIRPERSQTYALSYAL